MRLGKIERGLRGKRLFALATCKGFKRKLDGSLLAKTVIGPYRAGFLRDFQHYAATHLASQNLRRKRNHILNWPGNGHSVEFSEIKVSR